MSFTLYNYVLSGNCYKIRLMAALLGVKHETIAVDFYPGYEHRSERLRALNPGGTLPILKAGDLVLTETQAMLTWLATEFDQSQSWFPRSDPAQLAQVLEWLAFGNQLTGTLGAARLHDMLDWPVDGAAAKKAGVADLRRLELHLTDRVLEGKLWLAGDTPTIADIACFPYAALSPDAGISHTPYPALRNWLYALRALPGFITMPGIYPLHEQSEHASG